MPKKSKGPTPRWRHLRLPVISEEEAKGRTVIVYKPDTPEKHPTIGMEGKGPDAPRLIMECGNCGAPLVKGLGAHQLQNIVLRCNACGAYNESLN